MALPADIYLRDTRANQPAATAVTAGTIYFVTDESVTERSNGTAWEDVSNAAGGLGGSTGATDNVILRADGTGGATVQGGGVVTLSDAGALGFPDDVRQTFNPGSTNAGLNVGSLAGNPGSPSDGDVWYNSSTPALNARINGATVALGGGGVSDGDKGDMVVSGSGATWLLDMPLTPGGRLTLQTGKPVMDADTTAAGTVYYAPYVNARVPIYDATNWRMWPFSQLTLTLNSTDNTSTNLYDVFMVNVGGTLTLGTGPAWTNSTTRSAAITLLDGIWTNNASIAIRANGSALTGSPFAANLCTYLGTIYCTGNGQTGCMFKPSAASGGSANVVGVFNAYNRVQANSTVRDSTASWTYATGTWRAMNNNTANRCSYIDGLGVVSLVATRVQTGNPGAGFLRFGTSRDSTTSAPDVVLQDQGGNAIRAGTVVNSFIPSLGFHYLQGMEYASGGTATFYGVNTEALSSIEVRLEY